MNKSRFDKAFARFIHRREEKIIPATFLEVLAAIERERTPRTVELRARVIGNKLQFEPSSEILVQNNEIVVGNQRIVVKVS